MEAVDTELSLDLRAVEAVQRPAAWRDWMRASFPEYSVESIAPSPEGSAELLSLGQARLWRVHFPGRMRIRAAPAVLFPRDTFVNFQLAGARTVERDGRVFRVQPGDVCVGRAAAHGGETIYEEDTSMLVLQLPLGCVTGRHPQAEHWTFHVHRADQPGATLLQALLSGALAIGQRLGQHERRVTLASIIELLALPMVGVRAKDMHVERVERVLRAIDERLDEPRLGPEPLARELGISRRRLDEVFVSTVGSSVAGCIAQRRLLRAAQLLREPTCSELSVASIARNVGYRDAAHFARAFKRRFGDTPSSWRKRDASASG
ncbi:MAG TPA: helix-turn-helix domain-containing protein [Polyangiaceae bacterium]|nr:helix-turn-helix domain-containing protein [Polyangiaceae bacterium]